MGTLLATTFQKNMLIVVRGDGARLHTHFVGLSQLRASNPFTEIPITDENPDRASGIWVVNIETGENVARLRFSGEVEEIFAVQLVRGVTFPHIVARDNAILESSWALPPEALADVEFAPGPRAP